MGLTSEAVIHRGAVPHSTVPVTIDRSLPPEAPKPYAFEYITSKQVEGEPRLREELRNALFNICMRQAPLREARSKRSSDTVALASYGLVNLEDPKIRTLCDWILIKDRANNHSTGLVMVYHGRQNDRYFCYGNEATIKQFLVDFPQSEIFLEEMEELPIYLELGRPHNPSEFRVVLKNPPFSPQFPEGETSSLLGPDWRLRNQPEVVTRMVLERGSRTGFALPAKEPSGERILTSEHLRKLIPPENCRLETLINKFVPLMPGTKQKEIWELIATSRSKGNGRDVHQQVLNFYRNWLKTEARFGIRPLSEQDLEQIARLLREYEHHSFHPKWLDERLHLGVFTEDGRLISMAGMIGIAEGIEGSQVGLIGDTVVKRGFRGRGFAKACVPAVVAEACRRYPNIDIVADTISQKGKPVSTGLYRRLGFENAGRYSWCVYERKGAEGAGGSD